MGAPHDPYFVEGADVLRNKVGATTWSDLECRENDLVFLRMNELMENPPKIDGTFGQVQEMHKALFQDVYEWAGELRTVDMSKGGGPLFQPVVTFRTAIRYYEEVFREDHRLRGMDRDRFVARLAVNFDNLNVIHPFREGNGRTQRAYWSIVAHEAGWEIPWSRISKEENIQASKNAVLGDQSGLHRMFDRVVRPRD